MRAFTKKMRTNSMRITMVTSARQTGHSAMPDKQLCGHSFNRNVSGHQPTTRHQRESFVRCHKTRFAQKR